MNPPCQICQKPRARWVLTTVYGADQFFHKKCVKMPVKKELIYWRKHPRIQPDDLKD
jgi:hypothetical protein